MTKSTITRERARQIFLGNGPEPSASEERELARMALAAMDSEPVAEVVSIYGDPEAFGEREIRPLVGIQQMPYGTKLYRHAQPATASEPLAVTDDELNAALQLHRLKVDGHSQLSDAFRAGFRYARRTTPQPAPLVSAELLHTAASAIEDLLTTKDRTGACVWFDLPFRLRSAANAQPAPVVPDEIKHRIGGLDWGWEGEFNRGWNACRAAMLAADPQLPGSDPATVPGKWIPVSERLPEDSGRYWCYVEEQNDLGKSHYQWNCSWNGDRWWVESEGGGIVTHWMPLPAAPQEVNRE
ncbi:DUF551 domain-containing protein [Klebsiella pneumoniae]|uniref:DUF551 domain-containing protein n=1 Tax=Klebsiella pneumoniae TaxID=573 RepID=UPI00254C9E30|nr:DUF551 domain-containing protein [Klebsiella pneumoniae]MDK6284907.1 DUF551 domain-containing protein [Klebsiella pneumoniae]